MLSVALYSLFTFACGFARGAAEDVLTDELISRHYGASVRILKEDDGRLVVVPVRRG